MDIEVNEKYRIAMHIKLSLRLTKHHAMKTYGGLEV
jgi:hypothetical protein